MTKEEFIDSLSKSDDKISIIKEIKSMRDVGLRFSFIWKSLQIWKN